MYLSGSQAKDYKIIRYLAEQIVSEPVTSIRPLLGGMTSYNFEINHHLIFKVPSLMTPVGNWIRQNKYAPVLQKYLSFKIPQPQLRPVFLNSTSQDFLLSSFYEKIPGKTISSSKNFSKKDRLFKEDYFNQLTDVAQQIHAVSPEKLPVKIPTTEEFLKWRFSRAVGGMAPFQKKLLHSFIHSSWCGLDKDLSFNMLCHCDLRSANVCLDKKNHITGILDFDSLSAGEAVFEFRPKLYSYQKDETDTKLFYQVYCKKNRV